MRTETTGNAFQMRRLGERDVDAILALCEGNRLFYQYHPPMATRESILADMTALPPGKGMEDKAYVGFFEGKKLVAVLDWISGYPAKETAWIGLFMVSVEKQGERHWKRNHPRHGREPESGGVSGNAARRGQGKSAEPRVLDKERV